MIHLTTAETLDGGYCDYCAEALEPGVYTTVDGYALVSEPLSQRLIIHGPFVPCVLCYGVLGLPNIDFDKIEAVHKAIAVKLGVNPDIIHIEVDDV